MNLHDVATGVVLFRTRLPGVVQGYPVTYAVDGKQYLAVAVGGGRVAGSVNILFVFAVPDIEGSKESEVRRKPEGFAAVFRLA